MPEAKVNSPGEKRTVFVIGAGASKEFGLPTGAELKKKIASLVDIYFEQGGHLRRGDHDFVQTLRILSHSEDAGSRDINSYLHAGRRIRDNMPLALSIDNFLDTHKDDAHVVILGKLAISSCILDAEKNSLLFVDRSNIYNKLDFSRVADTWIAQLFACLFAGRTFASFEAHIDDVTFISFNYDRCIHQFVYAAARSYFNLNDRDAINVLSKLNVIYPYGSVGKLRTSQANFTTFGDVSSGDRLIEVSKGIRTFTEGCEDSAQSTISDALNSARNVFFMGFGFLPLNMRMLVGDQTFEVDNVFATGKGMSLTSRQAVREELSRTFKRRIFKDGTYDLSDNQLVVWDKTCAELIFEHQRLLLG